MALRSVPRPLSVATAHSSGRSWKYNRSSDRLYLVSGQRTPHHVAVAALVARHGLEARVLEADLPVLGRRGGGAADPCSAYSSYLLSTLYL